MYVIINEINLDQSKFVSSNFGWVLLEFQAEKFRDLNLFKLM